MGRGFRMRVCGRLARSMAVPVLAAAWGMFAFTGAAAAQGNSAPDAVDDTSRIGINSQNRITRESTGDTQDFLYITEEVEGGFVAVWADTGAGSNDPSDHSYFHGQFDSGGAVTEGPRSLVEHLAHDLSLGRDLGISQNLIVGRNAGSGDTTVFKLGGEDFGTWPIMLNHAGQSPTITGLTNGHIVVAHSRENGLIFIEARNRDGWNQTEVPRQPSSGAIFDNSDFASGSAEQTNPHLEALTTGNYAVAWEQSLFSGADLISRTGIVRFIGFDHDPVTNQVSVFSGNSFVELFPDVSETASGSVVVWQSSAGSETDLNEVSISFQRFNAIEEMIGPIVTVVNNACGAALHPRVAAVGELGFVVSWRSMDGVEDCTVVPGIYFQVFDLEGVPLGPVISIDQDASDTYQYLEAWPDPPALAARNGGVVLGHTSDFSTHFDLIDIDLAQANSTTVIPILANDTDADNDPLTITAINGEAVTAAAGAGLSGISSNAVTLPSGAGVSLADGGVLYDPTTAGFAAALPAGVTADDTFTYTISDGALTDTASVTVTVTGVNDAPVLTAPASMTIEEDTSDNPVAGISIADPDTGDTLTVSITASSTVSFGTTTGLVFTEGDGTDDATMTFSGTLAAVNTALAGLTYSPSPNASGAGSISITITDSDAGTDNGTIAVTIDNVNDAPDAVDDEFSRTAVEPLSGSSIATSGASEFLDDPAITTLSDGTADVVAYTDRVTEWAALTIVSRDGGVLESPIRLSGENAKHPDLVALPGGGVAAAWVSSPGQLRVQFFDNDLTPGNEHVVTPAGGASAPSIAALTDESVVVVWHDGDIWAQIYDQTDGPLGSPVSVNTTTSGDQTDAAVVVNDSGTISVTWTDGSASGTDLSGTAIRARVFDSDLLPLTGEVIINSTTDDDQYEPRLAALSGGQLVFVWTDKSGSVSVDDRWSVRCQLMSANLVPIGDEFVVNQTIPGFQYEPDVARLSNGGFIVSWTEESAVHWEIFARRFSDSGEPLGNEFQVSDSGEYAAYQSEITGLAGNGFAVTWIWEPNGARSSTFHRSFVAPQISAGSSALLPVLANDTDADDDPLTITAINGEAVTAAAGAGLSGTTSNAVTLPSGAGAALAEGGILYDPTTAGFAAALPAGATADDTFTYTISDGALTDTANVTVTVTGVNDAPTADDDTLNVLQDDGAADVTATLLAGDSDPDTGETALLAISAIDDTGTTGNVTLNAGAVSYSPNGQFASLPAGATAADSFDYTVSDPSGASDAATVSVTVTGTNDAPVAANDALATTSTVSLDGNLFADNGSGADSDVDNGDSFTVTAVNGVPGDVGSEITLASGALLTVNSNGTVAYDPNGAFALAPGATAQDNFTYTIADGPGATSSATVTVTVTGNTPPDAVDDVFVRLSNYVSSTRELPQGSPYSEFPHVSANASGRYIVAWITTLDDGQEVRARVFNAANAAVSDEIVIGSGATRSENSVAVRATVSGDFIVSWLSNAAAEGARGQIVGDIQAQRVSDSGELIGPQFPTSSVGSGIQFAPTLAALSGGGFVVGWLEPNNDTQVNNDSRAKARVFDGLGNPLTADFEIAADVDDRGLVLHELPANSFVAAYTISGSMFGSVVRRYDATGSVIGNDINYEASLASRPVDIEIINNERIFILNRGGPAGGIFLTYVDVPIDFEGTTESQEIGDSGSLARSLTQDAARAQVELVGGNILIILQTFSDSANSLYGTFLTGPYALSPLLIRAGISDSLVLEYFAESSALSDGRLVSVFHAFQQGNSQRSVFGSVTQRQPFWPNQMYPLPVLANDTDVDNDPLTITSVNGTPISAASLPAEWRVPLAAPATGPVTLPSGSVVSLGDGVLDYDPTAAGFAIALPDGVTGDDTFTYTISDGAATDTANVTVTLTGVNDAPSADADALTADEDDAPTDVTAALLDGDTDPDTGETAQLVVSAIDTGGTQGLAAINAGVVTYTPNGAFEALAAGQTASDSFGYTVSDPGGLTASATATVTVQGENDPPIADADALTFGEEEAGRDVTATLLDGDSDPDNGETAQLAVTAVDTTLTLGRVTLADGVVTYDPNGAFNALAQGQSANDRFDYTISDPHGATATATATVTINGFNGYALTVSTSGLGAGTVTSLPLGINCGGGGGCTALFTQNTDVALSALVAPGTTFDGWSGDCLDPNQPLCVVRMTGNRSVSARFSLTTVPEGRIVAATLPGARSGFVGGTDITVFMSVVSRATTPAQACRVTAPNDAPFTLTYRQINAQNEAVGDANPLFDLANGGGINFVLALTPSQATPAAGYLFQPQIACENADLAPIEGVNSVLVSIGAAPVPDILSIGATPSADGVVRIPETGNRINFLSAAAVNIGVGDGSAGANEATVTASVDTGAASLPVTLEVCETAPTGGCITPRGETEVTSVFAQNAAKFFAVFVRANGEETVPFNPASARVFLRFADASGAIRSVTSAAISAPAPANAPADAASLTGRWSVLVRQPSGEWPSLRRGSLHVFEDGTAILDDGRTPRTLTLAASGAANDNEAVSFRIGNGIGTARADGNIRLGDPLADQPGAFWGIRETGLGGTIQPGRFGDNVVLTTGGGLSGSHGGCAFTGQVSMRTGTGSVTLRDCAQAGDYRAALSAAGTAAGHDTLTIANDRWGSRLEAVGSNGR
ncbi:beta strand repeat-containing protein [Hyphobacterium marinum]|uniref:Ig-like domain-containing protein n=1 Tax=Hyphobacterium marinum TaxID=3116574 RepID=A0ABU7LWA6_9PROT|nr:Ig-like domain-containing protein [Hyphobacterium sp. Y6023]MEE2565844.1 Ig-like domain-containing protein [Hyphobacterium sp. Y6023]